MTVSKRQGKSDTPTTRNKRRNAQSDTRNRSTSFKIMNSPQAGPYYSRARTPVYRHSQVLVPSVTIGTDTSILKPQTEVLLDSVYG